MKFLKWFFGILFAIILVLLLIAFFLPSSYQVERSITFKGNSSIVFDVINDLKKWDYWSPWKAMEPTADYKYNDTVGVNGEMSWVGKDIGSGSLRIKEITDTSIMYKLQFLEPWESESQGWFIIKQNDENVTVTWRDKGDLPYPVARLMTIFMNFDEMMGPDFEKGLSSIKSYSEKNTYKFTYEVLEKEVKSSTIICIREKITMDKIAQTLEKNYTDLMKYAKENNVECIGPPLAITISYDSLYWDFEAAIPISKEIASSNNIQCKSSYSGKVAYIKYLGPYDQTAQAYYDLEAYINQKGYKINGGAWEAYVTDPATEPDNTKWLTEIYYPIK